MNLLIRAVLFVPVVLLVNLVFSAPKSPDVRTLVRTATSRSVKVYFWAVVIVLAMEAFAWAFLPG